MGEIFGNLYCLFEDFFGIELANYLWGQSSPQQFTNMYIGIGLSMVVISLLVMILFYYVINHPKMCNWWSWMIFLGANAIINFIVGWQWVLSDFYKGLMVTLDPATNQEIPLAISESDILCFGISNMIISVVVFILCSYLFKWWSSSVSKAPF